MIKGTDPQQGNRFPNKGTDPSNHLCPWEGKASKLRGQWTKHRRADM